MSVYDNALEVSGAELMRSDDRETIQELPDEIGELTKLRHLNVRFNRLASLPASIGKLTALKELHLESNRCQVQEDEKHRRQGRVGNNRRGLTRKQSCGYGFFTQIAPS